MEDNPRLLPRYRPTGTNTNVRPTTEPSNARQTATPIGTTHHHQASAGELRGIPCIGGTYGHITGTRPDLNYDD